MPKNIDLLSSEWGLVSPNLKEKHPEQYLKLIQNMNSYPNIWNMYTFLMIVTFIHQGKEYHSTLILVIDHIISMLSACILYYTKPWWHYGMKPDVLRYWSKIYFYWIPRYFFGCMLLSWLLNGTRTNLGWFKRQDMISS